MWVSFNDVDEYEVDNITITPIAMQMTEVVIHMVHPWLEPATVLVCVDNEDNYERIHGKNDLPFERTIVVDELIDNCEELAKIIAKDLNESGAIKWVKSL